MADLVRVPLGSGGSILVEAVEGADGPVKAGRIAEAIRDVPGSLQTMLEPVTEMAGAVLERLRQAGPDEVQVEFGVDLASQAGAVIAKSQAGCHLKVTVSWHRDPGYSTALPTTAPG
ncbi:CU044_2847 family protein [Streptomyces yaizuensis]|uniref:Trypsin-co-occurring domain-containing protein n=1 Tax=Streptomyces yaizuensis TaxID=2989713 RepID=A0ABQ5NXQ2_9ACTN|nr:CU044_2847 family protein [Streptomyces sp. YSPA8]GLF95146.1 hypothetical protein SYYSPA8_12635 [Streptomyces sp. YSPA8]